MGKMSDEIRRKRLAELLGIEAPVEPTREQKMEAANRSREAEATLLYMENRAGFVKRACIQCKRMFAVNRVSIGYCGDKCRQIALMDRGLVWDPFAEDPKERWSTGRGGQEPLTVPPDVLELLGVSTGLSQTG